MDSPVDKFWQIRLAEIKQSLEANNFDVFVAQNAAEAKNIVLKEIIPNARPQEHLLGRLYDIRRYRAL